MPSVADFDRAFGPMYSTIVDGYTVKLMAPMLAKVNGRTVTDYDCYWCGDVGRHTGEFCPHQEAMIAAIREANEAERMQDYADEADYAMSVAVGMG